MVGQIIHTSAWSHNCGMHVLADYLVEQIKKKDFNHFFCDKAYDELLVIFQKTYQQGNLSWEAIRAASLEPSRVNTQIIWGFALRMMLPEIIRQNSEYKQNLANQYLPLLNLIIEEKWQEAQDNYPILFMGNQAFLKERALNAQGVAIEQGSEQAKLIHQNFEAEGFERYCETLLARTTEEGLFLWLGTDELTIICDYFKINPIVSEYESSQKTEEKNLFFVNQGGHWERKVLESQELSIYENDCDHSFFNNYLDKHSDYFIEHRSEVGQIFFSEKYFESASLLTKYSLITNRVKPSKENLSRILYVASVSLNSDAFLEWFKDLKESLSGKYDQVLFFAVKQKKYNTVKKLLHQFPKEFKPENCMLGLIEAINNNDQVMVYRILAAHQNIEACLNKLDKQGIPPLYYAIKHKNVDLVKTLLNKGASATYDISVEVLKSMNFYFKDSGWVFSSCANGFQLALEMEAIEIMELILQKEKSLNYLKMLNRNGENIFHVFAKNEKIGCIEKLNQFEAGLASQNERGQNCLHLAVKKADIQGVKLCLEHKLALDKQDNEGNTPLHLAVLTGNLKLVKYLIDKIQESNKQAYFFDYDLELINKNKETALNLAYAQGNTEMISFFKEIGYVDLVRETYLELEKILDKSSDCINNIKEVIVKNKKNIKVVDSNGNTLLHYVCFLIKNERTQFIIKLLIEHGAKVQTLNRAGYSALHFAAQKNNVAAISVLVEQGAFVNGIDYDGLTPCHFSVLHDEQDAFLELQKHGASLSMQAFPSAIKHLSFEWDVNQALTPVNLAEKINGDIEAYLHPNKVMPKAMPKANESKKLAWFQELYAEKKMLEETRTYQTMGFIKMGGTVIGAFFLGPYFAAAELVKQGCLYARPAMMGGAGEVYYYIKPGIHNYTWSFVSNGFDYGVSGLSFFSRSVFKCVNAYDFVQNYGRRIVGAGVGIILLKLAQKSGVKNKEHQAAALFIGNELGFMMVDAYNETRSEKQTHTKLTENHLDHSLNHAYKVWRAILGKRVGDGFVNASNLTHQWRSYFYAHVGKMERKTLEKIEGYIGFQKSAAEFNAYINGKINFSYSPLGMVKLEIKSKLNDLAEQRDRFLIGLNHFIHTQLPDSEYQKIMLMYAHEQKALLCGHLKKELESKLEKAKATDNQAEITRLNEQIKALGEEITESEKQAKQCHEQLPNGKLTHDYNEAEQKVFKAWSDVHHLETIKDLNPEAFIDMAYEDLGDKFTPGELTEYLSTMICNQNIKIDSGDLENFKLNIESGNANFQDLNFKQNLKSALSSFWHIQVEKHITNTTSSASETLTQSTAELENITTEFKQVATPEELRMLDLNQIIDVKKQKYDLFLVQKNEHIKKMALTWSHYSAFIQASLDYEKSERDYLFAKTQLEQIENACLEEIKFLDERHEELKKEFEAKVKYPEISLVVSKINKTIVTGEEGKKARDKITKLMLKWLVDTNLISSVEANNKYKNLFYESLKKDDESSEKIETIMTDVLKNAWQEVLDKAQLNIKEVARKIEEQHQELEKAKQQVQIKKDELSNQKSIIEKEIETTLTKLKFSERDHFKEFSTDTIEKMTNLNNVNESLMAQYFAEQQYQYMLDSQKERVSFSVEIQLELEKLMGITITKKEIEELIEKAFSSQVADTPGERNKYIINYFVEKGLSNYEDLRDCLWDTLSKAQTGSHPKKDLKKRLFGQVEVLQKEFIPAKIESLKNIISKLQEEGIELEKKLPNLYEKLKNTKETVDLAKSKYVEKLTPEEKAKFQEAAKITKTTKTTKAPEVAIAKNHENFPNWKNPGEVLDPVIDKGFKEHSDVMKLAEFLADKIMFYKSQLYSEKRTLEAIEAERQQLIFDLKNYTLSSFKDRKTKTKSRVYDYMFAKINNIDKKPHHSRIERLCKPVINEIVAGCTGGYIPYKDFKGGEDHAGGQAGVKIACRTDGHMSVHMHSNNVPIMTLYESKQPALRINEPAYAAATPKQVKPISANQPTFQSQELMHAEQKSFSYSTPQTVLPGPIEAAGFSYQNPSYQFYTPLALQQSAAQSTPHKAKTANKAPVPNGGWSSTHEHIMGGYQNPLLALGGPRLPVNISAEWLSSLGPMREGRIPVAKLPGLVWDALGESGKELFDGTISLVKFTASEIKRDIKGEPLETTKAIALMGRFVSEEVARFVLNKDLETKKIIESMAAEFDNLSKEEKFKAGIKLYVSLVAAPIASVKGAQAANKAGKKMLEAVKKPKVVEAPPAPKALLFSEPVVALEPPSKTFTQAYAAKSGLVTIKRDNFSANALYLGEFKPHVSLNVPIPSHKIETFMGSTFKSYKLEQDAVLYRVGDSTLPLGEYYTFVKPVGPLADRIDRAILPRWPEAKTNNVVDTAYLISMPKGTVMHVGKAAPQGGIYVGGTEQIYIYEAWAIPGVKVVEKYPLDKAYLYGNKK